MKYRHISRTWPVVLIFYATGCVVGLSGQDRLQDVPRFGDRETVGVVEHGDIDEASGLVASRKNANVLWTHNDSGDGPRLFAMNVMGEHLGIYMIDGASNRDWEDISIGPGPIAGQDYLYIGDIGDNERTFNHKYIYRIQEPVVGATQEPVELTLTDLDIITLQYPDGNRDAETLMVDSIDRSLYIVSKGASKVHVYQSPIPQSTTETIVMDAITQVQLGRIFGYPGDLQGAVAGDISATGLEMLVKSYRQAYYLDRKDGAQPFFRDSLAIVPYKSEPQGEAIAWAADGSGYFTLSEERNDTPARLYFYPRINDRAQLNQGRSEDLWISSIDIDSLDTARMTLTAGKTQLVNVQLADLLGRPVMLVFEGTLNKGESEQLAWDTSELKDSIYKLHIISNHVSTIRRLQIDHEPYPVGPPL